MIVIHNGGNAVLLQSAWGGDLLTDADFFRQRTAEECRLAPVRGVRPCDRYPTSRSARLPACGSIAADGRTDAQVQGGVGPVVPAPPTGIPPDVATAVQTDAAGQRCCPDAADYAKLLFRLVPVQEVEDTVQSRNGVEMLVDPGQPPAVVHLGVRSRWPMNAPDAPPMTTPGAGDNSRSKRRMVPAHECANEQSLKNCMRSPGRRLGQSPLCGLPRQVSERGPLSLAGSVRRKEHRPDRFQVATPRPSTLRAAALPDTGSTIVISPL